MLLLLSRYSFCHGACRAAGFKKSCPSRAQREQVYYARPFSSTPATAFFARTHGLVSSPPFFLFSVIPDFLTGFFLKPQSTMLVMSIGNMAGDVYICVVRTIRPILCFKED